MKKANVRKPTAPWAAEIERQLVISVPFLFNDYNNKKN